MMIRFFPREYSMASPGMDGDYNYGDGCYCERFLPSDSIIPYLNSSAIQHFNSSCLPTATNRHLTSANATRKLGKLFNHAINSGLETKLTHDGRRETSSQRFFCVHPDNNHRENERRKHANSAPNCSEVSTRQRRAFVTDCVVCKILYNTHKRKERRSKIGPS